LTISQGDVERLVCGDVCYDTQIDAQFAGEIASKLVNEKLLSKPEAASVTINLLGFARGQSGRGSVTTAEPSTTRTPILTDSQYRELLQKAVTEALSYSRPVSGSSYSPERDAALNLLYGLRQLGPELDSVSGGGLAAVQKKLAEINPESSSGEQFGNVIGNNPVDSALETIEKAPRDQREQLYLQLAGREANNGDTARARQIIKEHVTNPSQQRQALINIEQQEILRAINKGRVENALKAIGAVRNPRERANQLAQIASPLRPGILQRRADLGRQTLTALGARLDAAIRRASDTTREQQRLADLGRRMGNCAQH